MSSSEHGHPQRASVRSPTQRPDPKSRGNEEGRRERTYLRACNAGGRLAGSRRRGRGREEREIRRGWRRAEVPKTPAPPRLAGLFFCFCRCLQPPELQPSCLVLCLAFGVQFWLGLWDPRPWTSHRHLGHFFATMSTRWKLTIFIMS
jgi:hypothetical protein